MKFTKLHCFCAHSCDISDRYKKGYNISMAMQISLLTGFMLENSKPAKRVRKDIPTYKKVYSVYQYDREKYMLIWDKLRELAYKYNNVSICSRVSPYMVLRHCYLKEEGVLKHLGDERHIFRVKALHSVMGEIYNYSKIPLQDMMKSENMKWEQNGVVFYYDCEHGGSGEIQGTESLTIKERLKLHIKLLRLLRKGYTIEKAMRLCK